MYKLDSDIIRYFKLLPSAEQVVSRKDIDPFEKQSALLKEKIMNALEKHGTTSVYGIQNDGDEIMTGAGLAHVKHCELRPEVASIYAPSFSFKNNFHWLQTTFDMRAWGKQIRHKRKNRYRDHGQDARGTCPGWRNGTRTGRDLRLIASYGSRAHFYGPCNTFWMVITEKAAYYEQTLPLMSTANTTSATAQPST